MSENFFWSALLISLTLHTGFLWGTYFWKIKNHEHHRAAATQVEISFKRLDHKHFDIPEYPVKPSNQLDLSNAFKLFSSKGGVPIGLTQEKPSLPFGMRYESKPDMRHIKQSAHRVFIRPIQSEKINNSAYTMYCEMIRNRIKEKIYENYDKIEQGEVYLTFVLNAHGTLVAVKIIPENTNASVHLQDISMLSLQQASPFPPFLKGMTLPEYTFNIEVQYQVGE